MTYASDMDAGIASVYDFASVPCTYTDRDSVTTTVNAIVEHDLYKYGDTVEIAGKVAIISVRVSEMTYAPRRGETYTIGSTVYVVDSVVRSDELEHAVLVA